MLEIGQAIDIGLKRSDSENQDSLLVLHSKMVNQHPPLMVVADGMGGYDGGALASSLVVESFSNTYLSSSTSEDYKSILQKCTFNAHNAIMDAGVEKPTLGWMGSTVVSAVISKGSVHLVNVGDSRAYLINKRGMQQISYDHSLVAEEIRKGNLTDEEARFFPQRNVLTMSLSARRFEIDPYLASCKIKGGDSILLCSDGLWGPVLAEDIQKTVMENPPQQAAEKLVELANQNGGPDNISVIIARLVKDKTSKEDTRHIKS